jgi:hypothetical protein
VQQALPIAFATEAAAGPAKPASRVNKLMVTGAAVMCAGAMAISPVSPISPMSDLDIQQRAVALAAAANPVLENPLVVWENIFTNTLTQGGALVDKVVADPFPILNQLGDNASAYLDVIIGAKAVPGNPRARGTGIVGSVEGIERTITKLQTRIAAASAFLAAGQFTEAFVELNTWFLVALEDIGQPLLPILGIPGDMVTNLVKVYDSLVTRGNASNVTRGLLVPWITAAFAVTNVADTVATALKTGNAEEAVTALINTPGVVLGAFLNGYKPFFGYDPVTGEPIYSPEAFQGVFSPLGTIDQFFVKLPQAIAAALAPPVVAVSSTSFAAKSSLVTLDVPADTAVESGTDAISVEPVSSETVVVDEVTKEVVADETATDEVALEETAPEEVVADEDAAEETVAEETPATVEDDADSEAPSEDAESTKDRTSVRGDVKESGAEKTEKPSKSETSSDSAGSSDSSSGSDSSSE